MDDYNPNMTIAEVEKRKAQWKEYTNRTGNRNRAETKRRNDENDKRRK